MKDYYSYWKIKRPVFACQDIETDFFVPESQQGLIKRLMFFCQQGSPLVIVNAPDGYGKSTLARWLYDQLPTETHEVLIVNLLEPPLGRGWLMEKLAQFFGFNEGDPSLKALASIDELIAEDKKLLIIIDNAHYLGEQKSFDEIASLMQLQAMSQNHLTFLLLSNTNLPSKMLGHPIANQVNFTTDLKPLSLDECRAFVQFQLKNQGLPETLMTDDSIFILHDICNGVLRQIATISENCLMEAFINNDTVIRPSSVIKAASYVVGLDEKTLRDRFIPKQPLPAPRTADNKAHSDSKILSNQEQDELANSQPTVKLRDLLFDDEVS